MISVDKEVAQFASWPTRERIDALKRIIPPAKVNAVLDRCGKPRDFAVAFPAGSWSGL